MMYSEWLLILSNITLNNLFNVIFIVYIRKQNIQLLEISMMFR